MSERSKLISRLLADKKFRAEYIKAKLSVLVPAQIRGLRLKSNNPLMPRQKDLASEMETHQSRISMFESPGANVTLDTLADIASALRCGLVVEFVPFSKMLKWENGFSQDAFDITRIDQDIEFLDPTVSASIEQKFAFSPAGFSVLGRELTNLSGKQEPPPPFPAAKAVPTPHRIRARAVNDRNSRADKKKVISITRRDVRRRRRTRRIA